MSQTDLLVKKHEKFFARCLQVLPSKLQSEDSNILAFIYFCLQGLSLLKKLDFTPAEQKYHTDNIYNGFLIDRPDMTAFRATASFRNAGNYDLPSLAGTNFALANLVALEHDFSQKLDRHKIMKFVQSCQITSGPSKGAFVPTLTADNRQFGETDLRLCYIAACIRRFLKYDELKPEQRVNDINSGALVDFILARINYNGGLSSNVMDEGHLGFTFCGVATLKLLGYDLTTDQFELTRNWLFHRHVDYPPLVYTEEYEYYVPDDVGGFNGRENKFSDTCYSWWCTATLSILDGNLTLLDLEKSRSYLLDKTQNTLLGGFGRDPEAPPDPFHAFLALASISLWDRENGFSLDSIDDVLVISETSKKFLEAINFE